MSTATHANGPNSHATRPSTPNVPRPSNRPSITTPTESGRHVRGRLHVVGDEWQSLTDKLVVDLGRGCDQLPDGDVEPGRKPRRLRLPDQRVARRLTHLVDREQILAQLLALP